MATGPALALGPDRVAPRAPTGAVDHGDAAVRALERGEVEGRVVDRPAVLVQHGHAVQPAVAGPAERDRLDGARRGLEPIAVALQPIEPPKRSAGKAKWASSPGVSMTWRPRSSSPSTMYAPSARSGAEPKVLWL